MYCQNRLFNMVKSKKSLVYILEASVYNPIYIYLQTLVEAFYIHKKQSTYCLH